MKNTVIKSGIKLGLSGMIALSFAALTACNGGSSRFGVSGANSPSFGPGNTEEDTTPDTDYTPDININIYNGSWGTSPGCVYDSQTGLGTRSFWDFQSGNGIFNSHTYSTSDCSGDYHSQQLAYHFQYGNTLSNVSSVCGNVVEVDMVLVSANQNGQPVDLSQLDPSIKIRQYNLLCANNNQLYFGNTRSDNFHDGSSLRRRPLALDQDYPFLRF